MPGPSLRLRAPFDAPEFVREADKLYSDLRESRFDAALASLQLVLNDVLNAELDPTERRRVRVESGRIKQLNRLLVKASSEKYVGRISTPEEMFERIHDIVGTRVTCNVGSDIDRVREILEREGWSTFRVCEGHQPKDYLSTPRDSGYRAYHVYVEIEVPSGGKTQTVVCEVQVRTLLQHAWGELTHEDTYKPGMVVPELLTRLSKRLATALAVMDEIAQDIRDELDRLIGESPDSATDDGDDGQVEAGAGQGPPELGDEEAPLSALFTEGERYLGEVVYAGRDYALVQLPPGRKGILHWSKVGAPIESYVDMRKDVSVGDTIRINVDKVDNDAGRLELSLVGDSADGGRDGARAG